jgi:glucose-1-phosphatase
MVPPPELVLFDLGGVLIELRGVSTMAGLADIVDEGELWRRWLGCRWVRRFERGECGAEEFASGVVGDWGLDVGPDEFLEIFASWPVGPYAGAEELIRQVRSTASVGCLSNTNVLHWDGNAEHWPLMALFDHRYVSHRLGAVKPDNEIFVHVVDALGVPAGTVLFLDDNRVNVEGARAAGLRAERAVGVDEARRVLEQVGIGGGDLRA